MAFVLFRSYLSQTSGISPITIMDGRSILGSSWKKDVPICIRIFFRGANSPIKQSTPIRFLEPIVDNPAEVQFSLESEGYSGSRGFICFCRGRIFGFFKTGLLCIFDYSTNQLNSDVSPQESPSTPIMEHSGSLYFLLSAECADRGKLLSATANLG